MKNFSLFGTNLFGEPAKIDKQGIIHNKYKIPPFSVLNTSEGIWVSRKKQWLKLGIKSELGRDAKSYNTTKWVKEKGLKRSSGNFTGTSIFDPVLCELMYSWFCPVNGQVLDPFAGGSVRGVIAHLLRYKYWGCDLSKKQIKANKENARNVIGKKYIKKIKWVIGDSEKEIQKAPKADFIFTCPPYGNLEVYSKKEDDLSNKDYQTFLLKYKQIIINTLKKLKPNSFACFVVSDFRDKKTGFYNTLVKDTISIFQEQGVCLYNEFILMTSVGSLQIRISKQFDKSKKNGKRHQNVLVFYKGDPNKIKEMEFNK